jgi:hypothetical protein
MGVEAIRTLPTARWSDRNEVRRADAGAQLTGRVGRRI